MKKRKWHKITAALATVAVILSSPGITDLVKGSSTEFVDMVPISEETIPASENEENISRATEDFSDTTEDFSDTTEDFLKQQRNLKRISEVKQPPRKVRKITKQTV